MADGRWSCSGCARKISVTAGTIFDRSRVSLQEWFAAAWYMTNQKHGVSALGLQRLLGLGSYQTAWTILQKLRTAMVRPGRDRLRGTAEVDETYVGGIEHGVRGRGTDTKFIVVIAVEVLSPKGFGRVRMQRVNDVSGASLVPFVCLSARRLSQAQKFTPTGGKVTTAFPNRGTGTARSTFPAPEIRHTFPCQGCIALLRCSNAGCSAPTKGRLQRSIWTPISTNSPFDSPAATPAVEACSSSDSSNMLSPPRPLGIDRRVLALRCKTTAGSGHCTKAATPLVVFVQPILAPVDGSNPQAVRLQPFSPIKPSDLAPRHTSPAN